MRAEQALNFSTIVAIAKTCLIFAEKQLHVKLRAATCSVFVFPLLCRERFLRKLFVFSLQQRRALRETGSRRGKEMHDQQNTLKAEFSVLV